ncbi:hypothetical protein PIROE2DRAFT_14304 [Piromyces sp. E2]|nr:hypothetical protein PIROE2DRAFT_14304 [Piromyces sp. E2]|eukprot:OUM60012.1 hypothetical protein PIROE2DRAFT_14304 [Piromyces sp. E2]
MNSRFNENFPNISYKGQYSSLYVGVYVRIYDTDIENQFYDELKKITKENSITYSNHLEKVVQYNKNNTNITIPEIYYDYGLFRINIYKNNPHTDYLSLKYEKYDNKKRSINESIVISIRNKNDYSCYILKLLPNGNETEITNFIKESDLFMINEKSNKSIIENDEFVIGLYYFTNQDNNINQTNDINQNNNNNNNNTRSIPLNNNNNTPSIPLNNNTIKTNVI